MLACYPSQIYPQGNGESVSEIHLGARIGQQDLVPFEELPDPQGGLPADYPAQVPHLSQVQIDLWQPLVHQVVPAVLVDPLSLRTYQPAKLGLLVDRLQCSLSQQERQQ